MVRYAVERWEISNWLKLKLAAIREAYRRERSRLSVLRYLNSMRASLAYLESNRLPTKE
jgi:hypothetical protein